MTLSRLSGRPTAVFGLDRRSVLSARNQKQGINLCTLDRSISRASLVVGCSHSRNFGSGRIDWRSIREHYDAWNATRDSSSSRQEIRMTEYFVSRRGFARSHRKKSFSSPLGDLADWPVALFASNRFGMDWHSAMVHLTFNATASRLSRV
jgi:hypothetical protein